MTKRKSMLLTYAFVVAVVLNIVLVVAFDLLLTMVLPGQMR